MPFLIFLLFCGYIFSRGFFNLQSFTLLFATYVIFIITLFKKKLNKFLMILNCEQLFLISIIFSIITYGGLYQQVNILLIPASYLLLLTALFLGLFIVKIKNHRIKKVGFFSLVLVAILLRLFMLWT